MKCGVKPDLRRYAYCDRFGIAPSASRIRDLTEQFMDQLDRCQSDEARRILLGISSDLDRR